MYLSEPEEKTKVSLGYTIDRLLLIITYYLPLLEQVDL